MGKNRTIINEFYTFMDSCFECLTTSDRYDDIMNHLNYVHPEIVVYCLHQESLDDLKRFGNIERKIAERRIPCVIIGDPEECEEFKRIAPFAELYVLTKPISSKGIESELLKILGTWARRREKEKEKEEEKARKEAKEAEEKRRKHILVVDDDSSVLKLIKGFLSERYDVATAINGKVALKFLEMKSTDLVLLDYEMPEENGAAVLSKIRQQEKNRDLPVVFLTGVTDKEKIREVLSMKPQGYLLKPIDMERLSSTIKGILD
jgi:CheY-like chemotaxis protein